MSLADRFHISAATLVVGFMVLGERILRPIGIGNSSRIQVSSFGARIPNGRFYRGLRLRLVSFRA